MNTHVKKLRAKRVYQKIIRTIIILVLAACGGLGSYKPIFGNQALGFCL
jgi:hypothetical protein